MSSHFFSRLYTQAIIGFARILDVSPKEIRLDFDYSGSIPGTLKPAAVALAEKIQELPDAQEEAIRQFIESMILPRSVRRHRAGRERYHQAGQGGTEAR